MRGVPPDEVSARLQVGGPTLHDILDLRLSHQDSIEWVAMVPREALERDRMVGRDREGADALGSEERLIEGAHLKLAEGPLDGDLDQARDRSDDFISGVGDGRAHRVWQLGGVTEPPDQHMGVQQDANHPVSASQRSPSGATISPRILICPLMKP